MKKRWIYASVTALFLGMMTGCAQQTQTETQHAAEKDGDTPAWKTYAKEDPVTLDWYVNYSWFDMGWGKNLVSQKITDETGVSVNFITPLGNEDEKLNALIASDSLPDLITLGWWEPQVNEMIQKNLVYALNDLADQYDMYFYKVADSGTDGRTGAGEQLPFCIKMIVSLGCMKLNKYLLLLRKV